ncbi:FRG domain-containing protein [Pediococcus parvulus]|uniref:FRG domain-containing protein n=1 Tax=Pediococcus parvulus TaxID=54062 RepID=UPI0021A9304F|nr:FRG domain-containing protein [Pediococcus parvulus]
MNIQSVNSFLSKKAESLKSIKANVTVDGRGLLPRFFYRGQSNDFKSSNNVASIFRQKELSGYTHEYSFTNEYMRRYANDFNNLENNFSRLSYMQHFGLPTRLLDVTTNALVALYFACQSHLDSEGHETDGIVTMFFSNKTQNIDDFTYYSSRSDTVEVLSTLALMDEEKKKSIYRKISSFNKNIDDLLKEDENHLYQSWYMDLVKQFPEGYYEQLSEENQKVYDLK